MMLKALAGMGGTGGAGEGVRVVFRLCVDSIDGERDGKGMVANRVLRCCRSGEGDVEWEGEEKP